MNREQRRRYTKKMKHDKAASLCPECGMMSRFISTRKEGEETALVCECCGKTVRQGEDITKSVPSGIYLPIRLDMLDMMLEAVKEETKDVLEGNEDCTNA